MIYKIYVTREYCRRQQQPKVQVISMYVCYAERDKDALVRGFQALQSKGTVLWDPIDGEPWIVTEVRVEMEP